MITYQDNPGKFMGYFILLLLERYLYYAIKWLIVTGFPSGARAVECFIIFFVKPFLSDYDT